MTKKTKKKTVKGNVMQIKATIQFLDGYPYRIRTKYDGKFWGKHIREQIKKGRELCESEVIPCTITYTT